MEAFRPFPAPAQRLGTLDAVCDWGYAPDYVDAMRRIVEHPIPDDYVIATGEPHTVRDLAEIAFDCVSHEFQTMRFACQGFRCWEGA